jgi:phosphoribosylformimino-5-aminoimidazole carboxamide ribotide isomerase
MNLYPAIDLKDGQCVRLKQGRMEDSTVFNADPTVPAKAFADAGCDWLHLVDLNGAFAGEPINRNAVMQIRAAVDSNIQLGGGIRTMECIAAWLATGISRVILGTIAVKNPELVEEACREFPNHIAVGIDTKGENVATEGWATDSGVKAIELAKRFADCGVAALIHTAVERDGMMQGPDLSASLTLADAVDVPVIVSGGVSSLDDLKAIRKKGKEGIDGAIVGRAIYEGMDVAQARKILEG